MGLVFVRRRNSLSKPLTILCLLLLLFFFSGDQWVARVLANTSPPLPRPTTSSRNSISHNAPTVNKGMIARNCTADCSAFFVGEKSLCTCPKNNNNAHPTIRYRYVVIYLIYFQF